MMQENTIYQEDSVARTSLNYLNNPDEDIIPKLVCCSREFETYIVQYYARIANMYLDVDRQQAQALLLATMLYMKLMWMLSKQIRRIW